MPRNIFIFLNIAVCFLVIVSKRSFAGQVGSGIFTSGFTFSGSKDTISLDFQDDFENGNFLGWNPVEDWEVSSSGAISGTYSLKHAAASTTGSSCIFHTVEADWNSNDVEWSFKLKNGNWDPSSSNKFWFYLSADTILPEQINGWAVGVNISGSSDLLQLWRIENGKADSLVVQTDLDWNASDLVVVKVRRTTHGLWTVIYQREGESTEKSFTGTDVKIFDFQDIGIYFQFTSTRAGQLWADDIWVTKKEAELDIQKVTLINSNTLSVEFNKPFLPTTIQSQNFRMTDEFDQDVPVLEVFPETEKEVIVHFGSMRGTILSLSVSGISDLTGQFMNPVVRSIDYSFPPEPGSVLINEILFNPFPGGVDFVELVNVSKYTVSVNRMKLAARNDTLALKQIYSISTETRSLYPGEYLVCTKDPELLAFQYISSNPETFCAMKSMPSFPDDAGTVVLLNDSLTVLDEFSYSAKMHSPFLADDDGVSLERVSLEKPSNDKSNWASAAASVGFATPGLPNSQTATETDISDEITVEPKAFSPNGDGYNDLLSIKYKFRKPGYLANVRIFNLAGRPVNYLVRNESLGQTGIWSWNGENENGQRLSLGVYIILVEVFDQDGNSKAFKKTCTFTDRLN